MHYTLNWHSIYYFEINLQMYKDVYYELHDGVVMVVVDNVGWEILECAVMSVVVSVVMVEVVLFVLMYNLMLNEWFLISNVLYFVNLLKCWILDDESISICSDYQCIWISNSYIFINSCDNCPRQHGQMLFDLLILSMYIQQ